MTDSTEEQFNKYSYFVDDTLDAKERFALLGLELRSHFSLINGYVTFLKQLELQGSEEDLAMYERCVDGLENSGTELQKIYSVLHSKFFDSQ